MVRISCLDVVLRFDEVLGQGVEQFGVGRRVGGAHVVHRLDQAAAEEVRPQRGWPGCGRRTGCPAAVIQSASAGARSPLARLAGFAVPSGVGDDRLAGAQVLSPSRVAAGASTTSPCRPCGRRPARRTPACRSSRPGPSGRTGGGGTRRRRCARRGTPATACWPPRPASARPCRSWPAGLSSSGPSAVTISRANGRTACSPRCCRGSSGSRRRPACGPSACAVHAQHVGPLQRPVVGVLRPVQQARRASPACRAACRRGTRGPRRASAACRSRRGRRGAGTRRRRPVRTGRMFSFFSLASTSGSMKLLLGQLGKRRPCSARGTSTRKTATAFMKLAMTAASPGTSPVLHQAVGGDRRQTVVVRLERACAVTSASRPSV